MRRIDLHTHTTASDGSMTPAETVAHAAALGLSAIAVTDHDTCAGVAEARAAGAARGLEIVPGIELSVDYRGYGVHILGYFVDPASPPMEALLAWVIEERKRRNRRIAADMQADGIPICAEALKRRYPGAVVGRPHFAAALVELGYAGSIREAFERYLNSGQKYYRQREYIPLREGLDVIRGAGGRAVFAHPLQYRMDEPELLALTRTLCDAGTVGMECLYSGYTPAQSDYLRGLAAHFGLCVTGGSDFHGARKPQIELGLPPVPYELLEALKRI